MPAKAVAEQVKFALFFVAGGPHPSLQSSHKVVGAIFRVSKVVTLRLAGHTEAQLIDGSDPESLPKAVEKLRIHANR